MISFLFMSLCFNNKDYPRRSWNTKSDDIDKNEHLCSSFLGEKVALLPDAAHSFGQTQKNLQFCGLIPGGSSRPKELIGPFHIGLFSSFVILYILGRWRRICISGLDPKLAMVIVHYVIGPEDSSISVWCVTLYIQVVGKQNKIKQKSLSRKTIKKTCFNVHPCLCGVSMTNVVCGTLMHSGGMRTVWMFVYVKWEFVKRFMSLLASLSSSLHWVVFVCLHP